MNTRRLVRASASIATLLACRLAWSQGGLVLLDAPPAEGYHLSFGPALLSFPRYPGANAQQTLLIPGVDFNAASGVFLSTDNGIGWNFSKRETLQWGVRLWPQLGRENNPPGLKGLPGVGDRLEKGLFLNVAPLSYLFLQSSWMYGAGIQGDGHVAEIGATLGLPFGQPDNTFGLTFGATWANGHYRQSYFGVTPAMSQASGLPAWTVGGGWQDVNVGLVGDVPINKEWKVSGQLNTARLLGGAADSPITQARNQTTLSVTLWYSFK